MGMTDKESAYVQTSKSDYFKIPRAHDILGRVPGVQFKFT